MSEPLPESLQPTAQDIARDRELAAEAKAILGDIERETGHRVKVNTESYNAVTFGPDGKPVSRVVNGVAQQTREQEVVARAQAAANGEVMQLERNLQHLIDQREAITGYDANGNPRYRLHEADREMLAKRIRQLRLGIVNQKRFNERRWRESAAPAVRQAQQDTISFHELAKELEAKGRVQRIPSW
jgi:hypothetical protein